MSLLSDAAIDCLLYERLPDEAYDGKSPVPGATPCILKAAGITPIETLVAQNVSVVRALVWTHETLPQFFIQFTRSPSGETRLFVQAIAAMPEVRFDVELATSEWDALAQRWAAQRTAILKPRPWPIGCITKGTGEFEIAENGKITRAIVAGCEPAYSFVNAFVDQATRNLPACAALPPARPDSEVDRLETCMRLAAK